MRIAIDATSLMKPERTGIARYVVNLVRGLASEAPPDPDFFLCYRLSRFSRRAYRLPLPGPRFRASWFGGPFRPSKASIAHGPDHRLFGLPGARRIVTVHDLFSLQSAEFGPTKFREKMGRRLKEVADRADRIVCISSWTRDRFWEHFHVGEDRFAVIPLGVEERFRPEAAERLPALRGRLGIAGPYVLFVGQISVRKNIGRVLDAFSDPSAHLPRLVLAGSPSYGHRDIREEVARRGLVDRVIVTGHFPDEDLPVLVAGAECLVFPSLLEGFGLPVLEAQASGVPVVCSDRGALPETSGGIRVPVDPEDVDSIREGVVRAVTDAELRTSLGTRGIQWASHYRWSQVARRTFEVYREVLG